jgi:hypothetical protein
MREHVTERTIYGSLRLSDAGRAKDLAKRSTKGKKQVAFIVNMQYEE